METVHVQILVEKSMKLYVGMYTSSGIVCNLLILVEKKVSKRQIKYSENDLTKVSKIFFMAYVSNWAFDILDIHEFCAANLQGPFFLSSAS